MKVYVITQGEYSDYHICAVTTDKEKAEILREKFTTTYEPANIEEYDTDIDMELFKYRNFYYCLYNTETKSIAIREWHLSYTDINDFYPHQIIDKEINVTVNADNEEMALKKASDIFAKFRAEQEEL